MTAPRLVANELVLALGPRLDDPSLHISELELKRMEQEITAALRAAPADARASLYSLRGSCLRRRGRLSAALADFRKAATLDQRNAAYANNVGIMYSDAGEFDEAERWIDEASARPNVLRGLPFALCLNRASIHRQRGNVELATSAFADAIAATEEGNPREQFSLALIAALLGRHSDALEFFARHVALRSGLSLAERSAADFIREHLEEVEICAVTAPGLARVLRAALEEDGESDADRSSPATIELSAGAWDRLTDLLEHPPEPSAALRKVLRERRG